MNAKIQKLYDEATKKAELLQQFSKIYLPQKDVIHTEKCGRPRLNMSQDEREEHDKELRRRARVKQGEKLRKLKAIEVIKEKFLMLEYQQQVEIVNELIKQINLK